VAFFSDSFHEVNGVALTSRQFEAFARRRQLPFFSVHAAPETFVEQDGTVVCYELQRGAAAFSLESDSELSFDLLLFRYRRELLEALRQFGPELLHVTGPGDMGMLGAWVAYELGIPMVASWHTNVHEYAGRRLEKLLSFLPSGAVHAVSSFAEKGALTGAASFYGLARLLFAPNQELVDLLSSRTGKPCFLMQRGVDAHLYTPAKREPGQRPFTIGYVGRLSVEKNVRFLAEIERAITAAGHTDYRFVVIGPGGEEEWLRQNMQRIELPGVLKGEDLAVAYANMDVFAFPSFTDTFGNVILEALASGVPPVVTNGGGPKFLVRSGETGFVAADDASFIRCILDLMDAPEALARMKRAARDHAFSISWDRVFEKVYASYESVLFPASDSELVTS
jgi:glycosyltransferase involved in cell wall biosynthesis